MTTTPTTTAEAFVRNGGDPQHLTPRPQRIVRETIRTSDGRCFVNGQEVARLRRVSVDPYSGSWGWLFAVKDALEKRRRGK